MGRLLWRAGQQGDRSSGVWEQVSFLRPGSDHSPSARLLDLCIFPAHDLQGLGVTGHCPPSSCSPCSVAHPPSSHLTAWPPYFSSVLAPWALSAWRPCPHHGPPEHNTGPAAPGKSRPTGPSLPLITPAPPPHTPSVLLCKVPVGQGAEEAAGPTDWGPPGMVQRGSHRCSGMQESVCCCPRGVVWSLGGDRRGPCWGGGPCGCLVLGEDFRQETHQGPRACRRGGVCVRMGRCLQGLPPRPSLLRQAYPAPHPVFPPSPLQDPRGCSGPMWLILSTRLRGAGPP